MHWRTRVLGTVDLLRPPGQARPQAEVEEELSMVSPEFRIHDTNHILSFG